MRFLVAIFMLVALVLMAIGLLIVGPLETLSIAYVIYAYIFFVILKNILQGKINLTSLHSPKFVQKKWFFASAALIGIVGGLYAFMSYWLTKDHQASIKILTFFTSITLLVIILAGGKIK